VDSSGTYDWMRIFPHVVADYTRRPRAFVTRRDGRRNGEINGLGVRHQWIYIWACEGLLVILFYSDSFVLPAATFYYPYRYLSQYIQSSFSSLRLGPPTFLSLLFPGVKAKKKTKPQPSFGVPAASKFPPVELIPGRLEIHPVKRHVQSTCSSQNVQEGCL
jgi:hypothetical protein